MARDVITAPTQLFVELIAKGKTQYEAYREAYPQTKASRATIDREAASILRRPKVKQLLAELKEKVTEKMAERIAIDRQVIVDELWDNAQKAKAAVQVLDRKGNPTGEYIANFAASNAALVAIGKELGMFREAPQPDDPLKDLSYEQVKALRDALDAYDAAEAAAAAESSRKPVGRRKGTTTH